MTDDLLERMNDARDFPANTCGASRHAAMIAEALCKNKDYPMLVEEPEHCGESIAATVAMLWECRAKLDKAVDFCRRLERLAMQSKDWFVFDKCQEILDQLLDKTDARTD